MAGKTVISGVAGIGDQSVGCLFRCGGSTIIGAAGPLCCWLFLKGWAGLLRPLAQAPLVQVAA